MSLIFSPVILKIHPRKYFMYYVNLGKIKIWLSARPNFLLDPVFSLSYTSSITHQLLKKPFFTSKGGPNEASTF